MMEQVSRLSFHHVEEFLIVLSDRRDSNLICVSSLHLLWMDRGGVAELIWSDERRKTLLKIVLQLIVCV